MAKTSSTPGGTTSMSAAKTSFSKVRSTCKPPDCMLVPAESCCFDARSPAAKLKDRVHLHGAEAGISEDGDHLVANLLLKNIIQRRRRVCGAHRDVNILIQRP